MVYKILRWDSIEQNNQIVPMIYFQPCLKIVNIMKLNNNKVSIQITGTAMYDGIYNGVANKSSILPNCRPNFFEATNLHVIILNTIFLKYPDLDKMGTFEIFKNSNKPSNPPPQIPPPQIPQQPIPQQPIPQQPIPQQPIPQQPIPQQPNPYKLPNFRNSAPPPHNLNGLEIGLIVALLFMSLVLIFGGGWAYQKINKRKK